jgi:hypothetical protein
MRSFGLPLFVISPVNNIGIAQFVFSSFRGFPFQVDTPVLANL